MHLLWLVSASPTSSSESLCHCLLWSSGGRTFHAGVLIFEKRFEPFILLFESLELILKGIKLGLPSLSALARTLSVFEKPIMLLFNNLRGFITCNLYAEVFS